MGILADLITLVNGNTEKTLDVLIQEKATETNSKIDNRASQESIVSLDTKVQTGNNLIGATNNTGGTASAGSIFAKLNKLLTDWTTTRAGYLDTINTNVGTLLDGRVVKSVQRGVVEHIVGQNTHQIYISPVNLNKSLIIVSAQGRPNIITSTANALCGGRLLSSNQIEVWITSSTGQTFALSWELIEFY